MFFAVLRDQNFGDFSQCPMRRGHDDVSALGGENTLDVEPAPERRCAYPTCQKRRSELPKAVGFRLNRLNSTRLQDATTSAPKTLAKLGVVADARSDQISKRAPVSALYS